MEQARIRKSAIWHLNNFSGTKSSYKKDCNKFVWCFDELSWKFFFFFKFKYTMLRLIWTIWKLTLRKTKNWHYRDYIDQHFLLSQGTTWLPRWCRTRLIALLRLGKLLNWQQVKRVETKFQASKTNCLISNLGMAPKIRQLLSY